MSPEMIHQGRERYGPMVGAIPGQLVQFRYKNWRDQDYDYVIEVESLQYGRFRKDGVGHELDPRVWVLHGQLITRDGDDRSEMNPRRRTFLLDDIREFEVLT